MYSYCNLFVLGFMAKKEPPPFMQFISPYLVIMADQRSYSCKNEESTSQKKGCHKAGPCSSLDHYTSPHVNNDIIIHDLLMMNKFLHEQTTSMRVLQMGYLTCCIPHGQLLSLYTLLPPSRQT
jgi:hypothetical protein